MSRRPLCAGLVVLTATLTQFNLPLEGAAILLGVDQILDNIAINVEKQFPMFDYQMVQVGPNAFNFVCRGERKPEEVVAALEANA